MFFTKFNTTLVLKLTNILQLFGKSYKILTQFILYISLSLLLLFSYIVIFSAEIYIIVLTQQFKNYICTKKYTR